MKRRLLQFAALFLLASNCHAAIAYVSSVAAATYLNSAPGTIALTMTFVAGNWIGVCGADGKYGTTTITVADTNLNTWNASVTAYNLTQGPDLTCFYAQNISAGVGDVITVTFVTASGPVAAYAIQFSGIVTTSSIDTTATATPNGGSATITSGTYSTAQAAEVAVAFARSDTAGTTDTYSAGTGFTLPAACTDANPNGNQGACEYQIYSSTQSGVTAALSTSAASRHWAMAVMVVKGGGAAAVTCSQPKMMMGVGCK